MTEPERPREERPLPNFKDTETTFSHLADSELRRAGWLFSLMGKSWLTKIMSSLGAKAVKWGIPGAAWAVRHTIYRQFVGGTSLETAGPTIRGLHEKSNVTSILDYGIEAKSEEEDLVRFKAEVMRAIEFSANELAAKSVVIKITGLAADAVLERFNDSVIDFGQVRDPELEAVIERADSLCSQAEQKGIRLYIDAEETWFQNTIDQLADEMMLRYNRKRVVVLNTYQLYRHDRLAFLKASHERGRKHGYLIGAKLVRGAYMLKERNRAEEKGIPSPIQPNIEATHRDYNAAVAYCLEHRETIAATVGSHNEESMRLAAEAMQADGVPRDHPNVDFAQLLGMSDNLTFNLAAGGYNAAKYMVYGPVTEVLPYLVRRAQENTSVTGEMGRELRLIKDERRRRKSTR